MCAMISPPAMSTYASCSEYPLFEQMLEQSVAPARQGEREAELDIGVAVDVGDREAVRHRLGPVHVESAGVELLTFVSRHRYES